MLAPSPPHPSLDTFPCSGFLQYGLCRVLRSHTSHEDPKHVTAEAVSRGNGGHKDRQAQSYHEPRFHAGVLPPKWSASVLSVQQWEQTTRERLNNKAKHSSLKASQEQVYQ